MKKRSSIAFLFFILCFCSCAKNPTAEDYEAQTSKAKSYVEEKEYDKAIEAYSKAATLKPEYEAALREVDVEGTAVTAFAERHGLSPSNAGVRVFRARQALRQRVRQSCGTCAEHGCLNCTCPTAPPAVV